MSRAIRFTLAEHAAVGWAAEHSQEMPGATARALESLYRKMEKASQAPTEVPSLKASRFAELARRALPGLVAEPPAPTAAYWSQLQRELSSQGVTEADAERALAHVASWAKRPQELRSLARNLSRYLLEARTGRSVRPAWEDDAGDGGNGWPAGKPPELR